MYRTSKKSDGYSIDYRELYGQDIFTKKSIDQREIFVDSNVKEGNVKDEENLKKDVEIEERVVTKNSSFQHMAYYLLKKTIKILVTSIIISIFIVLITVVFGFVTELEIKERLIFYDNLIWPVVMQDPEPFCQESMLNRESILKAGVWDASFNHKSGDVPFDEHGRQIISGIDVRNSIYKLFNVDISLEESIPDGIFFFNYDVSEDKFYVESISNDQSFTPHTIDFEDIGENLIKLTVEYLSPQDQFDINMKVSKEKRVEKVMQYVLKKNEKTKNMYIFKVTNQY